MNTVVAWFARNTVAANMLMFCIVAIGLLVLKETPKEILPQIDPDRVNIALSLPGASPQQVESLLCGPTERAISAIESIKKIVSTASAGRCIVAVDLAFDADLSIALSKIDERLRLLPLPEGTERPIVQQSNFEVMIARLGLVGTIDYREMLALAEKIQADLIAKGLSKTIIRDVPTYRISIAISENSLQQYQLTFSEVAQALMQNASSVAAGTIRAERSQASITVRGNYTSTDDIANTIIRSFPDGGQLQLSDLALIHDGFDENDVESRVNGRPAVSISIYQDRNNNVTDTATLLNDYIARAALPDNVELLMLQDNSKFFTDRMDMLNSNALSGLLLVFGVLFLFLRARLAFWVTMGIPMAFLGGFIILYLAGGSINMISTFGILVVLGIVTDDAVILAENIHRHQNMAGKSGLQGAIDGTNEMTLPVFVAVLTTAITFVPLAFLPGAEGRIAEQIPLIVIAILCFSLIECFFILPAHLAHNKPKPKSTSGVFALMDKVKASLFEHYRIVLKKALYWRYATLLFFFGLFIICASLLKAGWVNVDFQFSAEAEIATGYVGFAEGSDPKLARVATQRLEQAALALKDELAEEFGTAQILHIRSYSGKDANSGILFMNLATTHNRKISGNDIMQRWRKKVGPIPEATALHFSAAIGEGNNNTLSINFNANNSSALQQATNALKLYLQDFDGVYNIRDSFLNVNQDIHVRLKPTAHELGLTLQAVSNQVRAAFSGIALAPLERNGEMLSVKLQLLAEERNSLWHLENLPIRLIDGSIVPLYTIAKLHHESSPSSITHVDGKRIASVSAQVDDSIISTWQLHQKIQTEFLDTVSQRYPGVYSGSISGDDAKDALKQRLWLGFSISLLVMYMLMAALFGSYMQPLLILTAVPFGLVGAFLGHLLLGFDLTYLSLAGMIAVSGIVINDEVVMVHYTNQRIREGSNLKAAITTAGIDRFLAVFLTSITTFFGLLPIMLETSWEAQFLIPLAISIAFGVMFSTTVTLIFLPALHLVVDDIQQGLRRYAHKHPFIKRLAALKEKSQDHH